MFGQPEQMCRAGLSASFRAPTGMHCDERRQQSANSNLALLSMRVCCHNHVKVRERVRWSILVLEVVDQAESVQTAFLRLLSLSWIWFGMQLPKAHSDNYEATVPTRPNRVWHKFQSDTTRVTLYQKGGRNFASDFFAGIAQRRTLRARSVYANHTSYFEVSAC